MKEDFRPFRHKKPSGFLSKIIFYLRMLFDLQFLTIYLDLKKKIPFFKGEVLDVGCGQSPYQFLLSEEKTNYYGIDTIDSEKFDYNNKSIIHFNGREIPFDNDKFDCVLCTEVLEHVLDYQQLVDEILRVMKKDATGIFTIPWSARYHYIPFDYFRFTPSSIKKMFANFNNVQITPRGTDLSSITSKIVVFYYRNLYPSDKWKFIFLPFWVLVSPFFAISVFIGLLSVLFRIGSDNDPLGYTIIVTK
jgi:SAM-dependent methyltransferase